MMILVRDVFQAKYGRGDELVALFKGASEQLQGYSPRILTDLSGSFFTVVTEHEFESFEAWQSLMSEMFALPEFAEWFGRMVPLVENGSREFYTIVD